MYTRTKLGVIQFSRPYPFDFERKQKVERVMYLHGIKSAAALAKKAKVNYKVLNEVINGTRLSAVTEKKIAAFFGMEREELFIIRSREELKAMFDNQLLSKKKGAA
ncbi:helix-turn-helix domain-containing protein [Treponema pedis]|uniref:helix-turn-helix domain-containing protein n=1 Tax=Treponema pedis TaxID=409322 RepID=UPI003D19AD74